MNVGVLLAAGASSRMGRPKALVALGEQSFLAHGVRTLWTTCDVVVVVLGANSARVRDGAQREFTRLVERGALNLDLHAARRKGSRGLEVRFELNPRWATGMLSSVRRGLAAAMRLRPGCVVVQPVDHPHVRPGTVAELTAVMGQALGSFGSRKPGGFQYALIPRLRGRRGHPIALSPALAKAVARDRAATSLSDAIRRNARLVGYLDVRDPGVVRNRNAKGD